MTAQVENWGAQMLDLRARWSSLSPGQRGVPPQWPDRLASMREQVAALGREGRWASGPHDLLSVVGLHRWELAHSAALAWLCNPQASHGLGAAFLQALIGETGDEVDLTGPVLCLTEVARANSRADVVIVGSGWTLVIEVKVDAGEQPRQAQRLYEDWHDDGDTRFIFLTRHGHPPATAGPDRGIWAAVQWRTIGRHLAGLTRDANSAAHGRGALTEYLRTLQGTF